MLELLVQTAQAGLKQKQNHLRKDTQVQVIQALNTQNLKYQTLHVLCQT